MIIVFGFNMQSKWLMCVCVCNQRGKINCLKKSDNVFKTLAHELHHLKIEKNLLGWELEELEYIAEQMKGMEDDIEENDQDMQRAEMIL